MKFEDIINFYRNEITKYNFSDEHLKDLNELINNIEKSQSKVDHLKHSISKFDHYFLKYGGNEKQFTDNFNQFKDSFSEIDQVKLMGEKVIKAGNNIKEIGKTVIRRLKQ